MRCFACDRSLSKSSRNGFTLLETVVGTVLMATFATAALLAFRLHDAQLTNGQHIIEATRFADQQIDDLLQGQTELKAARVGDVPGHPDWQWTFAPSRTVALAGTTATIGRFEVTRTTDAYALVSVEVVVTARPPLSEGAVQ